MDYGELINRRNFLKIGTFSLAGLGTFGPGTLAVEPIERTGPARLQLSLAAYSFRQFFAKSSTKSLDMFQFIDFCAQHGCVGTELTSYYFPKNLTNKYLLDIRKHAFLRGIAISGTAVGNTFTHRPGPKRTEQIDMVKQWIDHAAVMGAPHIRIFAGRVQKGMSLAEAKKLCIEAIEECADYAGKKGIFLGIENHGGIVAEARDILDIVRAVNSQWVGINLDTGNFRSEDPYADLAACAPFAVNVQVKVEIHRKGRAEAEPTELSRIVQLLRNANYQGYVALEYEGKSDPWIHIPLWLQKMRKAFSE
jgi:sugar phosphate isomerase/epimerase